MRGNAMSGAPIISGTNQLPKPPIIAGITMKNTMIRPCAVTKTLNSCGDRKNLNAGILQLQTDGDRHQTTDHAGNQREHQIHRSDVLVVRRIDEAAPTGGSGGSAAPVVRVTLSSRGCRLAVTSGG